jgi:DHA2 family multidrug resistance protein
LGRLLGNVAGSFVPILDIKIVASSLPSIQAALAIPLDCLSWIRTAYLIAEIVAIRLTRRLTRLLLLGGLFTAAKSGVIVAGLGCGLSGGFAALNSFGMVQSVGGGVVPIVFTSAFVLFPERNPVIATASVGIFAVLAPTLGPTARGYITENFSWHWLFFVNLGPGLASWPP